MKQFIVIILLVGVLTFAVPLNPATASPLSTPSPDAKEFFAPGSIIQFDHLGIEDGLSQNAGLVIFQDSRGYLWIGSQDGLNRYDGYAFKIYKHDPDNPGTISNNGILSIAEDSNGSLWIGTWGGGLNRFDPSTETFTSYQNDPQDPSSLSDGTVPSIKVDSNGTLWVATLGGLERYNPKTDSFDHFRNDPSDPNTLSSNAISFIVEDSHGQLWIGTGATGVEGSGLNRFDPATGNVTRYQHDDSNPESLASDNIASLVEAPDGTFWIATGGFSLHGGGLDQFDPRTGKARHFTHDPQNENSISENDLASLWLETDGTLWIGSWATGLNRMILSKPGYFTRYQHDPFFPDSLSGDEIWSLYQDHSGILWIGTTHSGINKLSTNSGQFSLYRNNPANPESLGVNAVGAFAEDKHGNIWIATWGAGLDRFNPGTGKFEHYRHDPQNPNSLSDDLFMDVYVDNYNTVWAGTLGKGLNQLNTATGYVDHFIHDPENPNSLANDNTAAIISDTKGGLWIGTFGGVSHYEPGTDTFTNYSHDPDNPSSLSENKVVSLFIDSKNTLWIGTWGGGLNQLDLNDPLHTDPQTATIIHYRHNADDSSSLSEDSVWSIYESSGGTLWLGTQLGLNRFDPATKTFKHYTEKNGLSNNIVLGILGDEEGNLWLTTNNGLDKFDPRAETFKVYDASDGLQSNEFNSNAYYRTRNGTMVVGGINGFNIFQPLEIKPNPVAPNVVVTRFDVFNQPQNVDLTGREPIRLSYKQDFISFEFAAFDFQAPQKNLYAYQMEGFNDEWIMSGSHRYATYTNLPGGEYVFRVKAANSDGVWNETGVAIPIVITPPVWQTWWFVGSLIVVAAALLAGGFRYRLSLIREQNVYLETQVSERTSELRETNKLLEKEVEQRKRAEAELAKHAAEELQQSEERFRATFENSAIGIALVGLDGYARMVNPAIVQMTGYSEAELLQLSGLELSYPEDRDRASLPMQELLEGRRETFQTESRFVHKDGRVYWVRQTVSAVCGSDGKPLYLIVMVEDIDTSKKAVLALQESEERFRAMFDSAAIGIGMMDLNRHVIRGNLQARGFLGFSEEELRNLDVIAHTHPDDRAIDRELFSELTSGRRDSYQIEKRYRHKDGRWIWARSTLSTVKDASGCPMYILALVEDINEHKHTLAELGRSEERFRAMFENAAIGIAMIGMDRRPLEANAALIKMTGYTPEEFFQLSGVELSYPEDAEIGIAELKDVLNGTTNSYQIEKRYVRKSGEIYWVRLTNSVVKSQDGTPQYFVTMVEDINDRKHAAEELHRSQARFQAIFDNVAVGVAVMTLERKPVSFNATAEKIVGYTAEEMQDIDPRSLAIPEDRTLDDKWFMELVEGKRDSYVMERRYRRKGGRVFWARINYSLVRDFEGKPDYLIGIIEDIDEQKRAAERLAEQEADYLLTLQHRVNERTHEFEEANQRLQQEIEQRTRIEKELAEKAAEEAVTADRTRLARDLHDAVTQTLFSASLTAEVLPDLWDMDVEEAKKSTEELRQLTRGALAEMRTLLLELRPSSLTQTSLSDLIKQLCEAFIGRSRLPIKLNIEGERELPPEVQVAFYRIAQESLNNVFKYARATLVNVNLFLSPSDIHFETCDNGIGFDIATSKPTSLGMRIMRERAEAIGAELEINSTPGKGTCVAVTWTENPNLKLRVL